MKTQIEIAFGSVGVNIHDSVITYKMFLFTNLIFLKNTMIKLDIQEACMETMIGIAFRGCRTKVKIYVTKYIKTVSCQ